ncbi:MAG: hypothetical protein AAGD25_25630 [Cyanobacteria bacterium P01_F01_bin.150]
MRTLEQKLSYEKLELIARSSATSSSLTKPKPMLKQASSWFRNVLSTVVYRLTHGHEPRIWTSTVKSGPNAGQTVWHLYDPMTQRRATLLSELEVRCWLDSRYSR